MVSIPPGLPAHLPEVLDIYNYYIRNTLTTFHLDEQPLSWMEESFSTVMSQELPFLIATLPLTVSGDETKKADRVVGYAYATQIRPRPAFAATVEMSLFFDPKHVQQGYGRQSLAALSEKLQQVPKSQTREQGVRELVAVVAVDPDKDVGRFYQNQGFRLAGTLVRVGWTFGRWIDTDYWQLSLKD